MAEKSEKESEDEKPGIMPDAIYVDDVQYEKKEDPFSGKMEYFESIQKIDKGGYPFFLRIFTFLIGIILLCWTLFVAFFQVIFSILATLCFFKVDQLNQYMASFWKILRRISAFTLSLFVATFAPAFGFGIMALYMMLQGENLETSFMGRLLKTHLKKQQK